ncbi:MAG: hypothetical protein ACI4QW_04280, partial [Clostridia bacterium]
HIHAGAIAMLCDFGYVNGDGTGRFYPDSPVKVQDCLKILIHALGYGIAAEGKGGYPAGYIAVANQLRLTKQLDRTMQQNATRGDVVSMVYYALYAELFEQGYSADGSFSKSDETLKDRLLNKDDIGHTSGVVTADYDTWLVRPLADIEENEIEIDGVRYTSGNIDARSLLGKRVEAYYRREDSGEKTILNIALSNKNKETVVDADKMESLADGALFFFDENDRRSKITFAPDAVYVYNNRVLTSYVPEDLVITQGRYVCIDNDADDLCEYAFIYQYESSVVDRVNPNGCIYLKNELLISGKNYVVIDEDDDRLSYRLYDGQGKTVTLADIEKDNTITVYKSKDGTFTQIVVSDQTVNGRIEEISGDGFVVIGGESYKQARGINLNGLSAGNDVTAFINDLGEIVYIEEGESTNLRYGYIVASRKEGLSQCSVKILVAGDLKNANEVDEESEDEETIPVLLCHNSEIVVAELENQVKVDGRRISAEDALSSLGTNVPVKFKLSAEGKLNHIERLPVEFGTTDAAKKMKYNAKDRIFGGQVTVNPFGVNEETKVICIPANSGASEEDMMTLIKIDNRDADVSYLASGYENDADTQCVKLLVIIEDMHAAVAQNITKSSSIGIVQRSYVKNENGEELLVVAVLTEEGEVQLTVKDVSGDSGDTNRLQKGDFIIYKLNNDGYLVNARLIKSLDSDLTHNVSNSGSEGKNGAITGKVIGINRLQIRNDANNLARIHSLHVQAGNAAYTVELSARNLPNIYIYNKRTKSAVKGTFDDVMYG